MFKSENLEEKINKSGDKKNSAIIFFIHSIIYLIISFADDKILYLLCVTKKK
jgi:hypothetical protein